MSGRITRILIGVDGSGQSLEAVRYVALNCPNRGVDVCLMCVLPAAPEETFWQVALNDGFKERMKEQYEKHRESCQSGAEEVLRTAADILTEGGFERGAIHLVARVWSAGVARDLSAEAQTGYDAVVVGRRGLGSAERLFMGSVSNKVAQRVSQTAVCVVGGRPEPLRFLIAADGSQNSAKMTEFAGTLAGPRNAEIELLHVVKHTGIRVAPGMFGVREKLEEDLLGFIGGQVEAMFDGYRATLEAAGVNRDLISSRCVFRSVSRAGEILAEAAARNYGTVLLGRRGISSVQEFLMGRVVTKVLNGADNLAVWIVP